jgi:FRG domain
MNLPGAEVRVSCWDQLIAELHSRALVPPRPEEGGHLRSPYVFRGVDDATWTLQTSLKRLPGVVSQNINLLERSLIRSFRKYANAGAFDDKSEWYVLAVAQHNGLPTRCLDWAASPLVAAHFACADELRRAVDGAIWCLHAGVLREINRTNNSTIGALSGIAWVYDTRLLEKSFLDLDALNKTLDKQKPSSKLMLLWEPPSLDARIANQSGLLSIMNDADESPNEFLETYWQTFPDLIFRIIIEASAKSEIRDMLDQNNISERMLFPGLPGLCSWLKRYYGKAW